jgi:hypothetical protein
MKRTSSLDPHAARIHARLLAGEPKERIAADLGVAASTLKSWLNRQEWLPAVKAATAAAVDDGVTREERLEAELRDVKARFARVSKSAVLDSRVLDAIQDALAEVPWPNPAPAKDPSPVDPERPAKHRQAVLLSDWHAGEVVEP